MEAEAQFHRAGRLEATWRTFMDLEPRGRVLPRGVGHRGDRHRFLRDRQGRLGPIAMLYAGSGSFVERDDQSRRAVIEAKGKDKRGNGTAGATVTIQLAAEGADATRADVTTDLSVTGKPAQFGRGVMQDVSDRLLQQFIECVEGRLTPARRLRPLPLPSSKRHCRWRRRRRARARCPEPVDP